EPGLVHRALRRDEQVHTEIDPQGADLVDLRGKGVGRLITGREERKTAGGCDSARKSDRGGPAGHRRGDDRQPGVQQWCVHAGFFPTFRTGQCPRTAEAGHRTGGTRSWAHSACLLPSLQPVPSHAPTLGSFAATSVGTCGSFMPNCTRNATAGSTISGNSAYSRPILSASAPMTGDATPPTETASPRVMPLAVPMCCGR